MEYIEIKDNKVIGHYSAQELPEGSQYKTVENFTGYVGIDSRMLAESGEIRPQEELISDGLVEDNRGFYWNKETKLKIEIKNIDVEVPDGFADIEPNQFDEWIDNKWVENSVKKKEHDDAVKISEAQAYLNATDYKVVKAIESGVALNDLYPGETELREEKRQIIRDLSF